MFSGAKPEALPEHPGAGGVLDQRYLADARGNPVARSQDPAELAGNRIELVAFDGVQGADLGDGRVVRLALPFAPSGTLSEAMWSGTVQTREALDLIVRCVDAGATSRLYQKLVAGDKIASSAGGWYGGSSMDFGKIALYAVPADGTPLADVEKAIDAGLKNRRQYESDGDLANLRDLPRFKELMQRL